MPEADERRGRWIAADALPRSQLLDELIEAVAGSSGSERADVGASLLAESYAGAIGAAASGSLMLAAALPRLEPAEIRVEPNDAGGIAAVELAPEPAALGDEPARLVDELLAALDRHLEPLLRELSRRSGRPLAAVRRSVADRLAAAFAWIGAGIDRRELASEWVEALRRADSPLAFAGTLAFAADGTPELERGGCCLWWRTDGGGYCSGCPLGRSGGKAERI